MDYNELISANSSGSFFFWNKNNERSFLTIQSFCKPNFIFSTSFFLFYKSFLVCSYSFKCISFLWNQFTLFWCSYIYYQKTMKMTNRFNPILIILAFISLLSFKQDADVFLFSYFKGNGKDGLHLAYSNDGLTWTALKGDSSFLKPEISKDKLMRDPCIIKGRKGEFQMVWTVSWNARGIGHASSNDLIHWSEQQYIPVMETDTNARNCWAPEIYYDSKEDYYLIYWATTSKGKFSESDSSSENGYNHRIYYVTTRDFKVFSETKLLYDQGFSVIDAVISKVDNKYIMILKDETRFPQPKKNLRIATSNNLTNSYSTPGNPISPSGVWVEGPTIIKNNNEYIIYFDMYRNHRMGAIKSADLINWTDISDNVRFPEGTRHGSAFKVSQKILDQLLNN